MTTTAERIGRLVRMALIEQGRQQAEVAQLLKLTPTAASRRFRGKVSFRADELARIAELLDVPITRFYEPPGGAHRAVQAPNGSAA